MEKGQAVTSESGKQVESSVAQKAEVGSNLLAMEFEYSICYDLLLDPVVSTLKGCPWGRGAEGVGRAPTGFVIGPPDGPYWGSGYHDCYFTKADSGSAGTASGSCG